ncbi:MAG: hypothetical protein PVJ75_15380 [Chloroflexota bacterium]|jgi:hypothetical protein
MRRNSTTAIWLALIMLILVSAAAVFFLVQRNTQLETDLQEADRQAAEAQATSDASAATRDRLLSDVDVRQAALNSVSATRDTLAAEAELNAGRTQELESALAQQADTLADAQATAQALALQVAIIAPTGDATVPPLDPLDIMATVRSDAGLDRVSVTVDGQLIVQLPADGQNTMNVRAGWAPPEEGAYLIGVEASAVDGSSETAEITVNAAYASPEARETALRNQLEEATLARRFPEPEAPEEALVAAEAAAVADEDALLHRLLLTGRDAEDELTIADEAFMLQALELITSETSYEAYLENVVATDLLAFYDPETATVTTYRPGDETGAFGRWQAVHALAHQWQAERLGLDELDLPAMDGDRRLATRALVEGDADFLQYRLLADDIMPPGQVEEVRAGLAGAAIDVTASLPPTLQATFEFAYADGVPFIQALYDEGGFAQVDDAWRQLPVSSEQILHPQRYLALDAPTAVSLAPSAASLGQEWQLVGQDAFGEFLLRQHLAQQPLTAGQIDLAATGWGGGRYAVYQAEGNDIPVVVIRLAWDSADDAGEFADVYAGYLALRFGAEESNLNGDGRCWQADGVGCLFQIGTDSLVVRAPGLALALAAAGPQLGMSQP